MAGYIAWLISDNSANTNQPTTTMELATRGKAPRNYIGHNGVPVVFLDIILNHTIIEEDGKRKVTNALGEIPHVLQTTSAFVDRQGPTTLFSSLMRLVCRPYTPVQAS
jgi:hypothetical protein